MVRRFLNTCCSTALSVGRVFAGVFRVGPPYLRCAGTSLEWGRRRSWAVRYTKSRMTRRSGKLHFHTPWARNLCPKCWPISICWPKRDVRVWVCVRDWEKCVEIDNRFVCPRCCCAATALLVGGQRDRGVGRADCWRCIACCLSFPQPELFVACFNGYFLLTKPPLPTSLPRHCYCYCVWFLGLLLPPHRIPTYCYSLFSAAKCGPLKVKIY